MQPRTGKFLIIAAQVMPVMSLAELLTNYTLWSAPISFGAIWLLGSVKCQHCGLPGWDKAVLGQHLPVSPNAFGHCPRCGKPMLEDEGG